MRHLDRGGDAVDQHHLVAPVGLIGLARLEAQRHEGRRRRRRRALAPPPRRRVAPHRVVPALVAERAKLLVHPHQRQPVPRRPRRIGRQQTVELVAPGPDLRLRLNLALVVERRRLGPQDLAHRVARNVQVPADLLDRPAPHEELAANPRNRVHALHPPPAHPPTWTGSVRATTGEGGSILGSGSNSVQAGFRLSISASTEQVHLRAPQDSVSDR
jgi:hypothetical protein